MKSVCYDSVLLTDQTEYEFFVDGDDRFGNRVGSILENNILSWFFDHPLNFAPYLFYEELDIDKNYIRHLNVGRPVIIDNRVPGDIDILLVDPEKPQHGIAIQVKRVKATINEDDEASLNIKDVPYSIHQTKEMFRKYQFYKSYLMLVILVDAQHRQVANKCLGISHMLKRKQFIFIADLLICRKKLGFMFWRLISHH